MQVGDLVTFTLYDKEQTGSVIKIYQQEGWEGYVNVLLKSKKEILVPISILKVV